MEPNHKRMGEIVAEIMRIRQSLETMKGLEKALRAEYAELVEYGDDECSASSSWVGNYTVSLSRSVSRKVDEKLLAELVLEHPGIENAFKATHKVIAKRIKSAGPVFGKLIESVLTDTPGSLAFKITERKEDE